MNNNFQKEYLNANIFSILFLLFILGSCKKSNPSSPVTPTPAKDCKLIKWNATEVADPNVFEYTSSGKLAKVRVFTNGLNQPPVTTQFEYDAQNRLINSYDSASIANDNEYSALTTYSNYNAAGYPQHSLERVKSHRDYETDYVYNARNSITKAIIQTFDGSDALYSKDTVDFIYDNRENFLKAVANVKQNGTRESITGIEIEGYDDNPCFYNSLGLEFNLHRIANSGAIFAAGYYGYYLYMPSANNPLKVFLHNQGKAPKATSLLIVMYTIQTQSCLPK